MSSNYPLPHHGHVPEYQQSGVPYVSSSHVLTDTTPVQFAFPYVARHITVFNSGTTDVRVGFTQNGVNSNPDANYFLVLPNDQSPRLEIKCDVVFIRKDAGTAPSKVSIVAALTNITLSHFFEVSGSNGVVGVG